MKKKSLVWISDCSKAINTIKKSLKAQEAANKECRGQISAAWSDRTRDEELSGLHKTLSEGRTVVRAYQTALHELKIARSDYNRGYDSLRNALSSPSLVEATAAQ